MSNVKIIVNYIEIILFRALIDRAILLQKTEFQSNYFGFWFIHGATNMKHETQLL